MAFAVEEVRSPSIKPMIRTGDDYRLEISNGTRNERYVPGRAYIIDALFEQANEVLPYKDNWHYDVYRLMPEQMAFAVDRQGKRYVYRGTDKGIVVLIEKDDGILIDYPSSLEKLIDSALVTM